MLHLTTANDDCLVTSFKNGDEQALEVIISRYTNLLKSLAYKILKDQASAEDAVSECFEKLLESVKNGTFTNQGALKSWLCTTVHHLCIDWVRKKCRRKTRSFSSFKRKPLDDGPNDEPIESSVGPEFEYLDDDLLFLKLGVDDNLLKSCLRKLPPEQQEIIRLRYHENLSYENISILTCTPKSTCLGRMNYAKKNLRALLSTKGVTIRPDAGKRKPREKQRIAA